MRILALVLLNMFALLNLAMLVWQSRILPAEPDAMPLTEPAPSCAVGSAAPADYDPYDALLSDIVNDDRFGIWGPGPRSRRGGRHAA